ncbi:MAG: methyltransferase domain-containing protein [Pseudonocardiales bacterium]|nr:methyltransferase domain-containing protein [Pseudonocardiales bacterium]
MHARLSAEPPAQVVDLGCGQGFSTIALARAYPKAQVVGIDNDEASVADARRLAEEEPDLGNVAYALSDASELATSGPYDLICVVRGVARHGTSGGGARRGACGAGRGRRGAGRR